MLRLLLPFFLFLLLFLLVLWCGLWVVGAAQTKGKDFLQQTIPRLPAKCVEASCCCLLLLRRGVSVTLCCPGPFQSGGGGKPRTVYGPAGLIQQANTGISKNKVPVPRAAQLVVTAAYHRLSEVGAKDNCAEC